jgi:hypothetical protein
MKCSTFLSTTGFVAFLFGSGFLLAPEVTGPLYGLPSEPHILMMDRYFGGTLMCVGLLSWLARGVRDDAALRALFQSNAVANVLGVIISAWAALAGLQSAMAWVSVALYGLFAFGCLYFLGSPTRRT